MEPVHLAWWVWAEFLLRRPIVSLGWGWSTIILYVLIKGCDILGPSYVFYRKVLGFFDSQAAVQKIVSKQRFAWFSLVSICKLRFFFENSICKLRASLLSTSPGVAVLGLHLGHVVHC